MNDTLLWVAVGLALYWFGVLYLDSQGWLPSYVGLQGPILTIHTKRGRKFLDRLAAPKRFWRAWGNFGLGIALVVMLGSFLLLVVQAVAVLQNPPPATAATQPRNVLVIPGVNDFLPLSVAPEILFGLLVGLVVHEGGHGLMCRVEDIDIESMGVALLAILPVGAFVEPDEESRQKANRGSQSRMFAAGVTNNFAVTLVAFLLLFGPVVGSISVASGAAVSGVLPGSAAEQAGIEPGDRIVAVGGQNVTSNADLGRKLTQTDGKTVSVTLADGTESNIERSLLVTVVYQNSPFAPESSGSGDTGIAKGSTITAVNGTAVHSEDGFRNAVENRSVASLSYETEDGQTGTVTGPIGAMVTVQSAAGSETAGGAEAAGMPTDGPIVLTRIDGERIVNASDLSATLDQYGPSETISVEYYANGQLQTTDVTLRDGKVGVLVVPGTSGISFNSFGVQLYPAEQFLGLLGGEFAEGVGGPVVGFLSGLLGVLLLPFASISLGMSSNFAGFVALNSGFFTAAGGPLSFLGDWGLFLLANLLFWTGWVNLNLGFFNCIPAFPLDGGHMLRMGTEAIVSRLPTAQGRQLTTMVTTTIGLVMLASLLLMVFGPQLLAG
ncbi:site-2 protease family protein [Halorussus halophilus]|uniref:site-2 protease family protein n=1 Tax=Halorussus halophilus TaxID=2650975 RepID=UPI0013010D80|nr:site-2 protease family protein [Halorussus halophilus]